MTAFQPLNQVLATLWAARTCSIYRLSSNRPHFRLSPVSVSIQAIEHPIGAMGASHIYPSVWPTVQPMESFTGESSR